MSLWLMIVQLTESIQFLQGLGTIMVYVDALRLGMVCMAKLFINEEVFARISVTGGLSAISNSGLNAILCCSY